jgi:hypothetical protein
VEIQAAPAACKNVRRSKEFIPLGNYLTPMSDSARSSPAEKTEDILRNRASQAISMKTAPLRRKPLVQSFPNKVIVIEVRISRVYPVNLFLLAGAQGFIRVQAPDAFKQPLAAQHFMKPCNAAGKLVGRVKEGSIRIGDLDASLQKCIGHTVGTASGSLALVEKLNGIPGPNRPVPEQTARHAEFTWVTVD